MNTSDSAPCPSGRNCLKQPACLILLAILLLGLWFRFPFIGHGLPYFYDEDEGHHFNRVVEMVKSGNLNPEYFRKPSLHFYLRIPVVMASFLHAVKNGHIRRIEEIKTKDPYGLAKYAFTSSHSGIVKWNRALSVALSLLIVLLTFLIAKILTDSDRLALSAAALASISPALIEDSAKVGVDTLMALMCTLAIWVSLKIYHAFSLRGLFLCGLVCGLAVSSKYNALPVVLLPIVVCVLRKECSLEAIAVAFTSPIIGFLAGSPFIVVSIPLFLNQFAYEIWHYGIAGHVGHTGEPGLSQAFFYYGWLGKEALGYLTVSFSLLGIIAAFADKPSKHLLTLFFPALFFLLMCSQKANFTRNMLVLVPILSVYSLIFVGFISKRVEIQGKVFLTIIIAALLIQPLGTALRLRQTIAHEPIDSRTIADAWLNSNQNIMLDTAISGQILFPPRTYRRTGVTRISEESLDPAELYLQGFDRAVVSAHAALSESSRKFLKPERRFPGYHRKQRIVRSPEIHTYSLVAPPGIEELTTPASLYPQISRPTDSDTLPCRSTGSLTSTGKEMHCWLTSRRTRIFLDREQLVPFASKQNDIKLRLQVMTPWPNQKLIFDGPNWTSGNMLEGIKPGTWHTITLKIPGAVIASRDGIIVRVKEVHSPSTQKVSDDSRRLGVAIQHVSILDIPRK